MIPISGAHEFPRWEELYEKMPLESMPWFNPELDDDLRTALEEHGVRGGSALDLGTGPGTQAIQLARLGFRVTATDLSAAAIAGAKERSEAQGLDVTWRQDDPLPRALFCVLLRDR